MAYGTPTDPVAGTVITVAYAVANFLEPIRTLRANTGAGDPAAANRVAISTGVGAGSAWGQTTTDVYADASVTDVKMANQKVNKTVTSYATFALAQASLSGFARVNAGSPIADAPTTALDWLLIQVKHPSADYFLQITQRLDDQDEIYSRAVVNGVAGTWRKEIHTGNMGGIAFSALTLAVTSNATIGGTLAVTSTLSAAAGAFAAAVTAASAAIAGAITAATLTCTGLVKGLTIESTVATGTAPLVVASTTQVANLRAATAAVATLASDSNTLQGNAAAAFSLTAHTHTSMTKSTFGGYTGSGSGDKVITGLGFIPKFVTVESTSGSHVFGLLMGVGVWIIPNGTVAGWSSAASLDADGFTLQAASGFNTANTFVWRAYS